MEKIIKTVFRAKDGKEFDTEDECEKHEERISYIRYFVSVENPKDDGSGSVEWTESRLIAVYSETGGHELIVNHFYSCILNFGSAKFIDGVQGPIPSFRIYLSCKHEFSNIHIGDELSYLHTKIIDKVLLTDTYAIPTNEDIERGSELRICNYSKWFMQSDNNEKYFLYTIDKSLSDAADIYAISHSINDTYYTKDGLSIGIGSKLSDAVIFGAKWKEKQILDRSMDEGTLTDWYISSIDETIPPIWTPEHISELLNDFYVIPKYKDND